jgi:restriction system protein
MMLPAEARKLSAEELNSGPTIGAGQVDFEISALIIPANNTSSGLLVSSTSFIWMETIKTLQADWSLAYRIPPQKWEEIIAGAFDKAGFDEVILTPRSGDHGRDVIATKHGVGCIKIIGSVKAYRPGNLVGYDDVRALLGVLSGERDASKGIIATTSGFPPRITKDPFIAPFLPTRLELMDGLALRKWLRELAQGK